MSRARFWRRRAPPRLLARGVVCVALLHGATPAAAQLAVLAGPSGLVGRAYDVARYEFAPAAFDVQGPLVCTKTAEWDVGSCPPRYVGTRALAGAVVLAVDPDLSCSFELYARAVASLGGRAFLNVNTGAAGLFDAPPGRTQKYFTVGDTRSLALPAADATQRALLPLVEAAAGGARLSVRVAPTPSLWAAYFDGPLYTALQVVLTLQALACLEFAAARLYTFVRVDGGPRASIPQLLLGVELLTNGVRTVYLALDPDWGRGVLDFPTGALLLTIVFALGNVTSAIFLVYFSQAASSGGLASLRLARGVYRRLLLAFVCCTLLLDLVTSLSFYLSDSFLLFMLKMFLTYILTPAVVAIAAALTARRVRTLLLHLPGVLLLRLNARVQATALLTVGLLLTGALFPWATWHPTRSFGLFLVQFTLMHVASYVQIGAFTPMNGVSFEPPFRRLCLRLAAELAPVARPLVHTVAAARRQRSSRTEPVSAAAALGAGVPATPYGNVVVGGAAGGGSSKAGSTAHAGAPEVPAHMQLGVSLAFLLEFVEMYVPDREQPSYDSAQTVLGLIGNSPYSLCERVAHTTTAGGHPATGRATIFVSHAHACSFARMVESLQCYLELHRLDARRTFFWVDQFCMRLREQATEVLHIGPIERLIGHVVMVIDPWDAPVCLTRAWCLYEAVHSMQPGGTFQLTLPRRERERFMQTLATDRARVQKLLTEFDVRSAGLSDENDRASLLVAIEHFHRSVRGRPTRHNLQAGQGAEEAGAADAAPDDSIDVFNAKTREAMLGALAAFSWSV